MTSNTASTSESGWKSHDPALNGLTAHGVSSFAVTNSLDNPEEVSLETLWVVVHVLNVVGSLGFRFLINCNLTIEMRPAEPLFNDHLVTFSVESSMGLSNSSSNCKCLLSYRTRLPSIHNLFQVLSSLNNQSSFELLLVPLLCLSTTELSYTWLIFSIEFKEHLLSVSIIRFSESNVLSLVDLLRLLFTHFVNIILFRGSENRV